MDRKHHECNYEPCVGTLNPPVVPGWGEAECTPEVFANSTTKETPRNAKTHDKLKCTR